MSSATRCTVLITLALANSESTKTTVPTKKTNATKVWEPNPIKWYPKIIYEAKHGNLAGVQAELDRGTFVDTREIFVNHTTLIIAAAYCQADVVKLLLDHGADLHAVDGRNAGAFVHVAYMSAHPDAYEHYAEEAWTKQTEERCARTKQILIRAECSHPKPNLKWLNKFAPPQSRSCNQTQPMTQPVKPALKQPGKKLESLNALAGV